MSVAFASIKVAGGPTVGFKSHGPPPPPPAAAAPPTAAYVGVREFFGQVTAASAGGEGRGPATVAARQREEENRAESSESSSIGLAGESSLSLSSSSTGDGGGDGEEVESKLKEGALGSLVSLEECLPIKRGLSSCFAGKSKSFASLADAAALGSGRELAKAENPFNKRRRVLMACKASWKRRASYAALGTCGGLRALEEEDGEKGEGRGGCGVDDESPAPSSPLIPLERTLDNTFRSPRSSSLSDVRHA